MLFFLLALSILVRRVLWCSEANVSVLAKDKGIIKALRRVRSWRFGN